MTSLAFATASSPAKESHKIRVFIVDDSVVVRRLLTRALAFDPDIDVVGSASSADMALSKLPQLQPDVMTLDIHMPGMSGLDLLPIVRERFPQLRTLIFSSHSAAAAEVTMDALMRGATGFLLKPTSDVGLGDSLLQLQVELTEKIRQLFTGNRMRVVRSEENLSARPPESAFRIPSRRREVLAIGVSTGGPTALAKVMEGLPHNFPLPIVIVQHMPPVFTKLLADRIHSSTGFAIVEAEDDMKLEPGKALIAPGDFHMRVVRCGTDVRVKLDQSPHERSCRPAVDVLFRSVANVYGGAVIATILTGMGQDGLNGSEMLVREGAHLIAQDEATSVVWGMPGAVTQAGLTHEVLPLESIADAILQQTRVR